MFFCIFAVVKVGQDAFIYPILVVCSDPSPLHFRSKSVVQYNPHSNPHPIIIRSGPNLAKNYGKGYGEIIIQFHPIRLRPYLELTICQTSGAISLADSSSQPPVF
jgi:hypothetical protein